jgi:hypothetical protein
MRQQDAERQRRDQERIQQHDAERQRQNQDRDVQARAQEQQRGDWGRQQDRDSPQRQQWTEENRRRQEQFHQQVDQRERFEQQQAWTLQQQRRNQQFRYQQDYWDHQRQLQERAWRDRDRYYNNLYFYSGPSFRYVRFGVYYETTQYGVDLIEEALNDGYEQGFRAGRADRFDGWRYDYEDSYPYRDANYGYYGYYISQSEYNYYFREGFRRGYEDGYYGRYSYGYYSGGRYRLQDSVSTRIFIAIRF